MNSKLHYTVFLLLGLIFVIFQTENAMVDSWYYASCVKYHHELLNSHHLLYNIIGSYWFFLLKIIKPNVEAISALNLMNAFSATLCLFVLYSCLIMLKNERNIAFWLTFFCGATFGFMRYATDSETYILPLLFSLISTNYLLSGQNKRQLLLSGFFASVSILIHQLHLWWALATIVYFLSQKPWRIQRLAFYTLPFLLIPIIYILAFSTFGGNSQSFLNFIGGEYVKGNATINISLSSLLLTCINVIRTFIQVHGYIAQLFVQYLTISLIIIALLSGLICFSVFRQNFLLSYSIKKGTSDYSQVFITALIFHLLFAFVSSGNAEFMVMLPFLLVLFAGSKYNFNTTGVLKILTVMMLIWNLSSAIIPNAILNISKVDRQVKTIENNTGAFFIWKNKPLVENVTTYYKGFDQSVNFTGHKILDKRILDSLLTENKPVFTDLPNTAGGLSRESFLLKNNTAILLKQFQLIPVDSFENIYGKNYIYLIRKSGD